MTMGLLFKSRSYHDFQWKIQVWQSGVNKKSDFYKKVACLDVKRVGHLCPTLIIFLSV